MKKITFILFALIAGTSFAQSDATGEALVNAEIVSPISINNGSALDFGRIIGSAEGGTVTLTPAGVRTASTDDLLAPSTTVAPAVFTITAANEYQYSISIPGITLDGGEGNTMGVVFTNSLLATGNSGTGAAQTLNVGGELTVNGGQAEGAYEGTVTVTVAYE